PETRMVKDAVTRVTPGDGAFPPSRPREGRATLPCRSPARAAPTPLHPSPGSALAHARTIRRSEPRGRVANRSDVGSRSDTGGSGTDVRSLVVRMAAFGHAGHPR